MSSAASARISTEPSRRETGVIVGAVLGATALAYLRTIGFQFVYDDKTFLVGNPMIRSFRFLPGYFTGHNRLWADLRTPYYRPIYQTWAMLNYKLFGYTPMGWHAVTVLLHLLATALTFFVARRLTRSQTVATFAALIFGLHPAHVESVAWVCGNTESINAVLLLGALLAFLKSREAGNGRWLAGSMAIYAVALLQKETAFVFPAVIFFYVLLYAPAGARFRRAVTATLPYALLACLGLVARVHALGGMSLRATYTPRTTIVLTWPSVIWFYLHKLLWPAGYSLYYDLPFQPSFTVTGVGLPALALIAVAAGVAWWWRKSGNPLVPFAGLWFLIFLVPVLDLAVFRAGEIVHDRYLYVPSFGFALLVALLIDSLRRHGEQLRGFSASQLAVMALVAAPLWVGTIYFSSYWHNDFSLGARAVNISPRSPWAHNSLGEALALRGDNRDAIEHFKLVVAYAPEIGRGYSNLGYEYFVTGDLPEAELYLKRGAELESDRADPWFYLGIVQYKRGELQAARASLGHAIEASPLTAEYHVSLGLVLQDLGDCAGARAQYEAELALDPGSAVAKQQLAKCTGP